MKRAGSRICKPHGRRQCTAHQTVYYSVCITQGVKKFRWRFFTENYSEKTRSKANISYPPDVQSKSTKSSKSERNSNPDSPNDIYGLHLSGPAMPGWVADSREDFFKKFSKMTEIRFWNICQLSFGSAPLWNRSDGPFDRSQWPSISRRYTAIMNCILIHIPSAHTHSSPVKCIPEQTGHPIARTVFLHLVYLMVY